MVIEEQKQNIQKIEVEDDDEDIYESGLALVFDEPLFGKSIDC
jgi:hypothetical protein